MSSQNMPANLPADGGMVARRAVVRWAWRLFRREWRQQFLVLALLMLATSATILSAATMYNFASASTNADEFGTADHSIRFQESPSADMVEANIAAARDWFGVIDVIQQRDMPVPGSVESVEFRAQDPDGAFSGPMLALREGRYPTASGEVAVTDDVATAFDLDIGDSFNVGGRWAVVGLVENPNDLNLEFALVAPENLDAPESVTILVGGSSDQLDSFFQSSQAALEDVSLAVSSRDANQQMLAAGVVLIGAAVVLLFVSLIAATGFVVLGQRRLRQLGMLAALGATERHIRLVMVTNGVVVGVVAAGLGLAAGLAVWLLVVPYLETAVGHRIDRLNVPWWMITTTALLAVVTATLAAWWPARLAAHVPVIEALSGRPSRPQPAHHSAARTMLLILGGLTCLALGDPTEISDISLAELDSLLLIGVGTAATVGGILLLGPLALGILAAVAGWLPVAVRLALRDLARYQARSGTALAAVSLALGLAAGIIITANAAEQDDGTANLSDRQLLIWPSGAPEEDDPGHSLILPGLTSAELATLESHSEKISGMLDDATLMPLDVATDPAVPPTSDGRQLAVTLAQHVADDDGSFLGPDADEQLVSLKFTPVFVATPALLELYGLDPESIDPGVEAISVPLSDQLPWTSGQQLPNDEPWLVSAYPDGARLVPDQVRAVQALTSSYSSLPGSFITPDALRDRGWESVRAGWVIEASAPISSEQLTAARELAAQAGLVIEAQDDRTSLAGLRSSAAAAGLLAALSVLAMTVGLIRSEATSDLRTLSAVGATGMIRRTLTAATAGALAFLGAVLGTGGAYLILSVGYFNDLGDLTPVPSLHLLAIVVGVPMAAAMGGWLLAGRQPATLARQAIE
jgi:putative ABC transport system permease protein